MCSSVSALGFKNEIRYPLTNIWHSVYYPTRHKKKKKKKKKKKSAGCVDVNQTSQGLEGRVVLRYLGGVKTF